MNSPFKFAHRLIGWILISQSEIGRLDEVQVLEDVVEQVLAGRLLLNLLNQFLFVQQDDLHVEGLGPGEARQ